MAMLAMGLILAGMGVYLLVAGRNPLSARRDGVLAQQDRRAARTNAVIDLSAAVALVLMALLPDAKLAGIAILVVGFAAALAYRLAGRP